MIASSQRIHASDVASHYDELDFFYRDIWGEHVHHGLWLRGDETREQAVRQLAQFVAREARVQAGDRVCDIGCGYGATAQMLAGEFGVGVTGMTISAAQHAIANERAGANPRLRFILGDWLENELPPESFDAAIAIESSEHMADKAAFFAQAHRVLRSGGVLVICAWLACEAPGARARRLLLEPICREGRMPEIGSESDYRRLAGDSGFAVERFADLTRGIARTWPSIARIFAANLLRKPSYARFLLAPHARNRVFALTILRLWIAFRTGAMRYGIFTLRKRDAL